MTPIEIVQEEGKKLGFNVSETDADYILWEETGFPSYWPDRTITPEENLRVQATEFFEGAKSRLDAKSTTEDG